MYIVSQSFVMAMTEIDDDDTTRQRATKVVWVLYEPVREKTNNLGSDQVQHKPGCTVTESG